MIRAPPRSTRPDTLLPYPTLFLSAEAVVLLRRGRSEEALALLARSRNPVAQVVAQAIQGRQRRELPEAVVREEVLRSGNERSEEHTSELQSLMRISYAVFCLKKKTQHQENKKPIYNRRNEQL